MRSVFLETYAKAILGSGWVWVFFVFLFEFVFPLRAGAVGEAGSWGDPHNQAGKSPLRRSLHATGWNWYRESFVACKQCQFAWNGVLLVSFFGLHGIRLSLETHPGLRPPPAPSRSRGFSGRASLMHQHCQKSHENPQLSHE